MRFSVVFGRVSNLGLILTRGVNKVCQEEMAKLSGLVELTSADCILRHQLR